MSKNNANLFFEMMKANILLLKDIRISIRTGYYRYETKGLTKI